MSSLLFDKAPSQSNEDSKGFEIGMINDTSTANNGMLQDQNQARSPFDIFLSSCHKQPRSTAGNWKCWKWNGRGRG